MVIDVFVMIVKMWLVCDICNVRIGFLMGMLGVFVVGEDVFDGLGILFLCLIGCIFGVFGVIGVGGGRRLLLFRIVEDGVFREVLFSGGDCGFVLEGFFRLLFEIRNLKVGD